MLITRRAEFSASHVCAQKTLSPEQNAQLYGPAANPNGHGHNYILEVTLEGEPDPVTGMVYDLKKLKELIQQTVVEPMDHRFLNYEVPPFDKIVPTTENVAAEIWRRLEPHFEAPPGRLNDTGPGRLNDAGPGRLNDAGPGRSKEADRGRSDYVRLSNIRLYETEDLYVDYAGPAREESR